MAKKEYNSKNNHGNYLDMYSTCSITREREGEKEGGRERERERER